MKQMLMCAAFAALTMWAGSLGAVDSSGTPLTGRLVLYGNPVPNKKYQAKVFVIWKKGALIEDSREFSADFTTDSGGYFSFPLPSSLSDDDQVFLSKVMDHAGAQWVDVNIPLDVVTTPYALVAAEAKTLVNDGDLVLSDAMLTVTDELGVKGTAWVTNGLAVSESLTAREFPTDVVNVANTRYVKLDEPAPDGGRLLWFGAEEAVMAGRVGGKLSSLFEKSSYGQVAAYFLSFDTTAAPQSEGAVSFKSFRIDSSQRDKTKDIWFKANEWKATTDGFCTWSAQSMISVVEQGLVVTHAGISVRSEDGHVLTVLPEGVVQGASQVMTFPVRKGDVVTVKYCLDVSTVAVAFDRSRIVTLDANMGLRFRPIGLGKRGE